jgi:hypothetical protein
LKGFSGRFKLFPFMDGSDELTLSAGEKHPVVGCLKNLVFKVLSGGSGQGPIMTNETPMVKMKIGVS